MRAASMPSAVRPYSTSGNPEVESVVVVRGANVVMPPYPSTWSEATLSAETSSSTALG